EGGRTLPPSTPKRGRGEEKRACVSAAVRTPSAGQPPRELPPLPTERCHEPAYLPPLPAVGRPGDPGPGPGSASTLTGTRAGTAAVRPGGRPGRHARDLLPGPARGTQL